MTKKKQSIDINKINIFNSPKFMKVWAQQFSKACGSDTFNVAPDTMSLRVLMDKFVNDYNWHLAQLGEEE
jgi:hypothetical protein